MTFNEKLVVLRKTKSITQEEFAKSVGVSRQAVYKWESGQSYPEVMALLKIKELFGVSIDDLLDDSFEIAAPEKKRKPKKAKQPELIKETITPPQEAEELVAVASVQQPTEPEEIANLPANEEKTVKNDAPEKKIGFFGRLFGRK